MRRAIAGRKQFGERKTGHHRAATGNIEMVKKSGEKPKSYSKAILKRALQQQLLEHEIKQNAASLQIEELLFKIQELEAWKESAKGFV